MRSLLEQRTPLYSQADLHITEREGDTPEDVAKRILEAIPGVLKTQSHQLAEICDGFTRI